MLWWPSTAAAGLRKTMRRLFLIAILLSTSALAEEAPATRFFVGPGAQLARGIGGGSGVLFNASLLVENGPWMVGYDLRLGLVATSFVFAHVGRVDRLFTERGDALYGGISGGYLNEFDGENFGGEGGFIGAQVGYVLGRDRRWGRLALELQFAQPLFGERAGKPGDYVYPLLSLGVRLFL